MPASDDSTATEVRVPKRRRAYSDSYKLRILEEVDACSELGGKGAITLRACSVPSMVCRTR